jgi:8-hydroxy-5-deazaflavin:NADPH oxidoreductase
MPSTVQSVGLLGGTGRSGPGLALRFAMAGVRVHIGSRDAAKGIEAAEKVSTRLAALGREGAGEVTGHTNAEAAALTQTVFVTVPYEGQQALLRELAPALAGRVVVSTVVPMRWDPALGPVAVEVAEGSAAEQAAALAPGARVVAGFHSLSSAVLGNPARRVGSDVIVTGDDAEAKKLVIELAELIGGVRGVDGGPLRYARFSEGLTVLLLSINRVHKAHTGVVITDLPDG